MFKFISCSIPNISSKNSSLFVLLYLKIINNSTTGREVSTIYYTKTR